MHVLRYRAVPGSLLSDPLAPGYFLGREHLPAPADGWEKGTKAEQRCPIVEAGCEVKRSDRMRWAVVLDALKKGVDLEPADEATAKFCKRPWKAEVSE